MIILSQNEAKTYEGFKQGLTIDEVTARSGRYYRTIRQHVIRLIDHGMMQRRGRKNKAYIYVTFDVPYIVEPVNPRPRKKVGTYIPKPRNKIEIVERFEEDPFLDAALSIPVDDEITLYLKHHKGKYPRKVLCQRTGLTRLQLNFILERLG